MTPAYAWTNGTTNAQDLPYATGHINGRGYDNPGAQGSYSVDNTWQDVWLSEWSEPYHDWFRDRYNRWSTAAVNNVLIPQRNTKAMNWEINILDQYYYNFANNWSTNAPLTKNPENENWLEELAQGYTEVDTEVNDPGRLVANVNYFVDYQMDSEKSSWTVLPEIAQPKTTTEIEWCDKDYMSHCFYDETGIFYSKLTQMQ